MRRNFKIQVAIICILLVGVVGLTIGFSAFSKNLFISSEASVNPESSTFDVAFSNDPDSVVTTGGVVGVTDPVGLTTTTAAINNSSENGPEIDNLGVIFKEPGQSVTYTFHAINRGKYTAYLKEIEYSNATGESSPIVCTAKSGTTQSYVTAACDSISLKVKVGEAPETATTVDTISNHSLAIGASEVVMVTIEYKEGGAVTDGDFDVKFGNIKLIYRSLDQ